MTTVDKDEFIKRAQQHAPQTSAADDFFGGLAAMVTLLIIAAILFGIPYLISLGWHAAMR